LFARLFQSFLSSKKIDCVERKNHKSKKKIRLLSLSITALSGKSVINNNGMSRICAGP